MHRLAVPVQIPAKEQESALAELQKKECTEICKCGTKRKPCKNMISHQMPQQPSLADQFTAVEVRNMEE